MQPFLSLYFEFCQHFPLDAATQCSWTVSRCHVRRSTGPCSASKRQFPRRFSAVVASLLVTGIELSRDKALMLSAPSFASNARRFYFRLVLVSPLLFFEFRLNTIVAACFFHCSPLQARYEPRRFARENAAARRGLQARRRYFFRWFSDFNFTLRQRSALFDAGRDTFHALTFYLHGERCFESHWGSGKTRVSLRG